jgi:hypothetical protein
MLDRPCILVLRRGRPTGRQQGLAGRVRNQMQMEEALRFVHGILSWLWVAVDK